MLFRKRTLIEYDPATLSVPLLLKLQAGLLAKLILVNDEIIRRDRNMVAIAAELPNVDRAREVFAATVARLAEMNAVLRAKFDRRQGKTLEDQSPSSH